MFMQLFFSSKITQRVTQRVTIWLPVSNQEVTKKTDKHAVDCSKAVCWGRRVIYARFINCSYNNVAKGIRLLDKKAFFVYTGKKIMQVRAFERYIP